MINKNDKELIDKLVDHFEKSGVINNELDNSFVDADNFDTILEEAVEMAKSEKELNPNFYNENIDKDFASNDKVKDPRESDNPMVNGYWDENYWE